MSKQQPILIGGQKVGRLKASWLLLKESWRYLQADKEMVWVPVVTTFINIFLFGLLFGGLVIAYIGGYVTFSQEGEPASIVEWAILFAVYVITAFTLALSQAAITHTVYTRAHNGNATLGQSLKAAFSHWFSLLVWSLITSTVGIIIRYLAERSATFSRIIILLIGSAWSVLTYFVVPAMVIDKSSAFDSISKSGQVFKKTWGETFVTNISLGLALLVIFLLSLVSAVGLVAVSLALGNEVLLFIVILIAAIWLIVLLLVSSVLEGIIKTLLYIYAAEDTLPPNFNPELLERMLVGNTRLSARTGTESVPVQPALHTPAATIDS